MYASTSFILNTCAFHYHSLNISFTVHAVLVGEGQKGGVGGFEMFNLCGCGSALDQHSLIIAQRLEWIAEVKLDYTARSQQPIGGKGLWHLIATFGPIDSGQTSKKAQLVQELPA